MRASVLVLNACQNSQSDSCFIAFRFSVKLRLFNSVHLGNSSLDLFFKQQYLPKVSLQGKGAIRAAWLFWKRKSSLFPAPLCTFDKIPPLDEISSHQAISGLSRHPALTVPGSNPHNPSHPPLLSHLQRPWWETSMCQSFLGRMLQIDPGFHGSKRMGQDQNWPKVFVSTPQHSHLVQSFQLGAQVHW